MEEGRERDVVSDVVVVLYSYTDAEGTPAPGSDDQRVRVPAALQAIMQVNSSRVRPVTKQGSLEKMSVRGCAVM